MILKFMPVLLVALAAIGCVNLPDGFVRVDPGDFEWRATSAGGVTAGLRCRPCPKEGSAEFWVQAVRKELEQGRAYTLEYIYGVEGRWGVAAGHWYTCYRGTGTA